MQVIGYNREGIKYELYFRSSRGYKSYITCFSDTAYGVRDLVMSGCIPLMSWKEYKALPNLIEVNKEE